MVERSRKKKKSKAERKKSVKRPARIKKTKNRSQRDHAQARAIRRKRTKKTRGRRKRIVKVRTDVRNKQLINLVINNLIREREKKSSQEKPSTQSSFSSSSKSLKPPKSPPSSKKPPDNKPPDNKPPPDVQINNILKHLINNRNKESEAKLMKEIETHKEKIKNINADRRQSENTYQLFIQKLRDALLNERSLRNQLGARFREVASRPRSVESNIFVNESDALEQFRRNAREEFEETSNLEQGAIRELIDISEQKREESLEDPSRDWFTPVDEILTEGPDTVNLLRNLRRVLRIQSLDEINNDVNYAVQQYDNLSRDDMLNILEVAGMPLSLRRSRSDMRNKIRNMVTRHPKLAALVKFTHSEPIQKRGGDIEKHAKLKQALINDTLKTLKGSPGFGNKYRSGGLYDSEIREMMKKYKKFVGIYSTDTLDGLPNKKVMGFILHIPSDRGGHWVAMYVDAVKDKSIEYYDSMGKEPPPEVRVGIKKIVEKINPDTYLMLKINRIKDQSQITSTCGYHAMGFLIDRFNGLPFKEATGFISNVANGEQKANQLKKKFKKFRLI